MKLRHLKISDLEEFITSNEFLKDEVIPITPIRALSQQRNPRAKPDDIVLTIAYAENQKILGYIGALPDMVNGVRCAWNSCWWVKPGIPAEVSMKLLFSFISNWNRKVLFSEMTPLTSSLIEQLRFCTHHTTSGFRGYNRFSLSEVLPRKKPVLGNIKRGLHLADLILNFFIGIFDRFKKNDLTFDCERITAAQLTDADDDFMKQFNSALPATRYAIDYQWIEQNPWVTLKENADSRIVNGYYFSYSANLFETSWVRFWHKGKTVALVNYTLKNSELKLPYVFCEPVFENEVGNYFFNFLKKNTHLSSITTFHAGLAAQFRNLNFIFKTSLPKLSAISNDLLLEAEITNFEMQMGDGDCVFT